MKVGLILGTGMDSLVEGAPTSVSTRYGVAYTYAATHGGRSLVAVKRHGPGFNIAPHMVNYRANICALKEAGVGRILATAAVGSMREDLPPGTLALVKDFVDFTKGGVYTIYGDAGSPAVHSDFSEPYCPEIAWSLRQAAQELGIPLGRDVVYVSVSGPRYETPAEIRIFSQWGDVVGMTGAPEAILSREMGICYSSLAIVANYAAGISTTPLSHADVVDRVTECRERVKELLLRTIAILPTGGKCNTCAR